VTIGVSDVRRVVTVFACALLPTIGTEVALGHEVSPSAVTPFRGDLDHLFPPTAVVLAPQALQDGAAAATGAEASAPSTTTATRIPARARAATGPQTPSAEPGGG
jgi:hypothetical protein